MVQTRSQTKTRSVNTPAVHRAKKPPDGNKRGKEIKPISNDAPIVIDLDTKPVIDTQLQDTAVTQIQPSDPTRPGVKQMPVYSHPITRPPPRPPDLVDNGKNSRTDIGTDPNLGL